MSDRKLHELLAVDGNLKAQADKTRADLTATFNSKRHLFTEKLVTFVATTAGEGETPKPVTEEQLAMQTNVRKELAWIVGMLAPALDVQFNVSLANTTAKASVVLG